MAVTTQDAELHTEYRIVIVGAGGSGKSCLTNKFLTGFFTDDYDPTIEDSYTKKTQVDDEVCILDILDTAGQEEYSSMLDDYMRTGQGFICVYSVTDKESFNQVNKYREKLWTVKDRDLNDTLPFILVANKIDLADKREVTTSEGQELAAKYKCLFLEASAKQGVNVTEAFHSLVREIRRDKEIRGYNLPQSKGPDEKMMEKIAKKFAKWGFFDAAKKQFNKFFGKEKKEDKKSEAKSKPTPSYSSQMSSSTPTPSPSSYQPSTSVSQPSSQPSTSLQAPSNNQAPSSFPSSGNQSPNGNQPLSNNQPPVSNTSTVDPARTGTQYTSPSSIRNPANQPGLSILSKMSAPPPLKSTGAAQPTNAPMKSTSAAQPTNAPMKSTTAPFKSTTSPNTKIDSIESDLNTWMQEINSNPIAAQPGPTAVSSQPKPNVQPKSTVATPSLVKNTPQGAAKYGTIPKQGAADLDFSKCDFFYGKIGGNEANAILAGKPIGTYIARYSSQPSHLAISYVLDGVGTIQSVLVGYDSSGIWMVDGDPEPQKYPDLPSLVKDYDNVLQIPFPKANPNPVPQKGAHYNVIPAKKS